MGTDDDSLEPDHPFYRVKDGDLTGEHGRLIRHVRLTGDVALNQPTYRVMYQSVGMIPDRVDQPIGVSGLVAFRPAIHPRRAGRS